MVGRTIAHYRILRPMDAERGAYVAKDLESDLDVVLSDVACKLVATATSSEAFGSHRAAEEPQLLLGHEGSATVVAVEPLGRWIASGGADNTHEPSATLQ